MKCFECQKKPRQRGALCFGCYDVVKARFGYQIGEQVLQFPFSLSDGKLTAGVCEVTDVMEYADLPAVPRVWIADVTVHEAWFVNLPKPSLRYEWRRGEFSSDPDDLRGSLFRLSEEILNSGALHGMRFRGESWARRKVPQEASLFDAESLYGLPVEGESKP